MAMRRAELLRNLVAHRVRRRRPRRQNRRAGFIRRVQHLILRLSVALHVRRQVVQHAANRALRVNPAARRRLLRPPRFNPLRQRIHRAGLPVILRQRVQQ